MEGENISTFALAMTERCKLQNNAKTYEFLSMLKGTQVI
jgi:hypothetical protein